MPITQIAGQMNMLQSGLASAERVFEFLDAPEEAPDRAAGAVGARGRPGRAATLEHVSFRYEPDKPLIEDFSLDGRARPDGRDRRAHRRGQDHPGQPAHALLRDRLRADPPRRHRLPRPDPRRGAPLLRHGAAGHLAVRGHDPRQHRLRRSRARPTRRSSPRPEAAYVDHFVRTLPDGYDTLLDEEASNLSAGQKQLLTIARAFLARPGHPDPRRGDQQRRHPHRGAHPGGDGAAAARPDQLRHRPPAVHHPRTPTRSW